MKIIQKVREKECPNCKHSPHDGLKCVECACDRTWALKSHENPSAFGWTVGEIIIKLYEN